MKPPTCTSRDGCHAPTACTGWGYCRLRNIEAGGMANVTEDQQRRWRVLDRSVGGKDV